MYKEASRYKQETLHSPITEIHLGCPREVIQGMKRRHGVGVVMENLLDSGSIQFYFEDFISIQASRCSWGNCSLIRIQNRTEFSRAPLLGSFTATVFWLFGMWWDTAVWKQPYIPTLHRSHDLQQSPTLGRFKSSKELSHAYMFHFWSGIVNNHF